jgi:ribosomal protein S18 acetylase RimI-like enzyme
MNRDFGTHDVVDTMRVDDTVLTIRTISIADVERHARLFGRLSPASIHFRFFSPVTRPPRAALIRLADVDHDRRDALVALDGDEIVAVARYDAQAGTHAAEVAVTVEDAWQRQGLGKRLAVRLARRAIDRGIESFEATVQPDNRPALGLLRKLSPNASVRFDRGEYAASIDLPAATSYGPPSPEGASSPSGPPLGA